MAKKSKAPITLAKSAAYPPKSIATAKETATKQAAKSASPAVTAAAKAKAAPAAVQAAPKQAPIKQDPVKRPRKPQFQRCNPQRSSKRWPSAVRKA